MTIIKEHVVVTCLGWKHPRRFSWKHPAPMFLVISIGPFTKWGIDFTTCHPVLFRGHHYIITVVYYFTKWVEAMLTFNNDREMIALFIFNQIVARFSIPKEIVTDHGNHLENKMIPELTSKLEFKKEYFSPYYP
jgi:hypothetical protein